ncbi:MAG TPA: 4-hydroxy-3-methylbut-2-enyl diphosphate reductase, partial [Chitinophagaceae bacterium]
HGKPMHEETRATFSHSRSHAPTVVVKDMEEARRLVAYITGEKDPAAFYAEFRGQYSEGFEAEKDLQRVGVVNQTTMLASETQAIADYIRQVMTRKYQLTDKNLEEHFADARDTLCYATNDNQSAVRGMLEEAADLAIVVGGYNSSNTSHLVELCEMKLPTYFISSAKKALSMEKILHWDFHQRREVQTLGYLPDKQPLKILLTSGASCPDALVEGVLRKLASFYDKTEKMEELIAAYT